MKKVFVMLFAAISVAAMAQNVKVGDVVDVDDVNYKIISLDPAQMEVTESPFAAGNIEIYDKLVHYGVTYTVVAIGKFAFLDKISGENQAITGVKIPNTIKEIGAQAFMGCNRIEKYHFPASLEKVGNSAFYCFDDKPSILNEVTCDALVPPTCGDFVFGSRFNAKDGISRDIPLNVPKGTVQAYRNAKGWEIFNIITDGEESSTVEEIHYDPDDPNDPNNPGGQDQQQGIEDVQGMQMQSTKTVENGCLIIKKDGAKYSAQGQKRN